MAHQQPTSTPATSAEPPLESSFESLFARHATPIYRFCLRLSRNPADAEDLVQEVFVAAFLGQTRFEGRSSLTTYLYRIAVFCWRLMRERGGRQAASRNVGNESDLSAPDIAASAIDRLDLDAALQTLDERHRTAFLLVKVEGMTCREASAVLGIPEGTVKYHIHSAVRHLQAALTKGDVAAPPIPKRSDKGRCHSTAKPLQAAPTGNPHEL